MLHPISLLFIATGLISAIATAIILYQDRRKAKQESDNHHRQ